jgi:hypothetical protein
MTENQVRAQHHLQVRNRLRPRNGLSQEPLTHALRGHLDLKFACMLQIAGNARCGDPRTVFGFDGFLQAFCKIILVQLSSLKVILGLIVAELLPNYYVSEKFFCNNRRGI